jgi:UDP:flavonoid glycosyltransferase YjiC (YdhE family)
VRDQAIFVGNPDDIVPDAFGPQLPLIGDWTREHYTFAGYVTGFDPAELADRASLRQELGYRDDEQVCIVTVGGSGVGGHLLRRVIAAFPEAKRRIPALRMVVVTGPRIDPATFPRHEGLELRAYVHQLYRHLAACDLAVVQGGLTTCMELTANRRPFLYFPLRHHFEQNFHVAHRLDRYRAGRRMDYATSDPAAIAAAIAAELGRPVDYRWRPTAPPGPPTSSPNSCEQAGGRLELGASLASPCAQRSNHGAQRDDVPARLDRGEVARSCGLLPN